MKFNRHYFGVSLLCLLACNNGNDQTDGHKHAAHHEQTHHEGEEGHGHHGDANHYMNQNSFEDLVANFESPERVQWQKPEEVIELFGPLEGKTIMDIGAGTGYFSFRLAAAGAKVIAADVDERFQSYITDKIAETTETNISTRMLPYDSPSLETGEVDHVIIVNSYHHIENRESYFAEVLGGLKDGGSLMVVDYKKEETPHGPPLNHRISWEKVQKELTSSGFSEFSLDTSLLDYQYILVASR